MISKNHDITSLGIEILWNNEPMPLRYLEKEADSFTCDGDPCTNNEIYYQKFPLQLASRFPMRGTRDITSELKYNSLYVSKDLVAYYILKTAKNATQPPVDWIDTGYYGQYFGNNVYAKIYKRIIRAGLHVIDLKDAALLFTSAGTSVSKSAFHFMKSKLMI